MCSCNVCAGFFFFQIFFFQVRDGRRPAHTQHYVRFYTHNRFGLFLAVSHHARINTIIIIMVYILSYTYTPEPVHYAAPSVSINFKWPARSREFIRNIIIMSRVLIHTADILIIIAIVHTGGIGLNESVLSLLLYRRRCVRNM